MATHSYILAWRIPWTEEPGGLQSMGLQEVDPTEVTERAHTPAVSFTLGRTTLGERPAEALPVSSGIWAGNAGPPGVWRRI